MPDVMWRYETLHFDTQHLGVTCLRVHIETAAALAYGTVDMMAHEIDAELLRNRPCYASARIDKRDEIAATLFQRAGFRAVDILVEMKRAIRSEQNPRSRSSALVRDALPSDAETFRRLAAIGYANRLAREPHLDPGHVRALYAEWAHNDLCGRTPINLLAIADGAAAGFIAIAVDPVAGEGLVDLVVVDPEARGRGIGEDLILGGLRRLGEHGATSVQLGVGAGNEAAIGLYRKLGFVVVRRKVDLSRWVE